MLADRTLNGVVAPITDDQWTTEIRASFLTRRTPPTPTLREIITNHAYDDGWVPNMVVDRTMDEVGRTKLDCDLLGNNPKGSFPG